MAIAKMSRVFIVGATVHKEETMRFLQHCGVVHLEPVVPLSGDSEKQASAALLRLRHTAQIEEAVNRYSRHEPRIPADCPDEALCTCAEEALNALQEMRNRRQVLERLAEELGPWGDFDIAGLRYLEENGVYVQRWRKERKKHTDLSLPDGVFAQVVSEKQGFLFFTLSLGGPIDIPGTTLLPLPEMRLTDCRQEVTRLLNEEETLAARLAGIALRADVLKARVTEALNDTRYLEQMGTLYAEQYLFGLQGWVPSNRAAELLKQVEAKHFPLQIELRQPLPGEEPPILYENNWFIRRIEPLLKLYGNPKYRNIDPSYFFAPFMILFFGICLSDAGYGAVFYLVSHVIGRKWGKQVEGLPLVIKLCKAFALSAILVGIITGSVFGYNFDERSWILLDVAVGVGDPMLFFYLALGLGVLHLSLSYLLGMMQVGSWPHFFPQLGLMCVLWGGVMLVARNIWFAAPTAAWHLPLT